MTEARRKEGALVASVAACCGWAATGMAGTEEASVFSKGAGCTAGAGLSAPGAIRCITTAGVALVGASAFVTLRNASAPASVAARLASLGAVAGVAALLSGGLPRDAPLAAGMADDVDVCRAALPSLGLSVDTATPATAIAGEIAAASASSAAAPDASAGVATGGVLLSLSSPSDEDADPLAAGSPTGAAETVAGSRLQATGWTLPVAGCTLPALVGAVAAVEPPAIGPSTCVGLEEVALGGANFGWKALICVASAC